MCLGKCEIIDSNISILSTFEGSGLLFSLGLIFRDRRMYCVILRAESKCNFLLLNSVISRVGT